MSVSHSGGSGGREGGACKHRCSCRESKKPEVLQAGNSLWGEDTFYCGNGSKDVPVSCKKKKKKILIICVESPGACTVGADEMKMKIMICLFFTLLRFTLARSSQSF